MMESFVTINHTGSAALEPGNNLYYYDQDPTNYREESYVITVEGTNSSSRGIHINMTFSDDIIDVSVSFC